MEPKQDDDNKKRGHEEEDIEEEEDDINEEEDDIEEEDDEPLAKRTRKEKAVQGWQINLQKNGDKLVTNINSINILDSQFNVRYKHKNGRLGSLHASNCSFELYDNNNGDVKAYSHALYSIETEGRSENNLIGGGRGVGSNIGNRTGHFMFLLQMFLAISTNVTDFRLENFTDNPGRAAIGIYKLLTPDFRTHYEELQHYHGNFSIEEILQITEGSMRLIRGSDDEERWKTEMNTLLQKVECNGLPWNYEIGMDKHVNGLRKIHKQTFLDKRGGSKKYRKSSNNKY